MASRALPKTLTREEVDALLAVPNLAAPTGLRNRVAFELMYRCGLRVSEVCGLHLRDWRVKDRQLHVRAEVAKGGREAFVYLDPVAEDFLERWKVVRRKYAAGKPHLLTTLQGGPISRQYMWQAMQRYARRAGIERNLGPHSLRHTFGTELLTEGFNIEAVRRLMRHADIRTTVVYLEVRDQELADKIRSRRRPAA